MNKFVLHTLGFVDMVMGISALTRQSVSNYDAESSETADAGPFSVIKHGFQLAA